MQVKPKICKGTNKAIGHGCGESKYIHRFGLCSKCFGTWLYSTDSGNELLEKSTMKGKKIVEQKEKKEWEQRKEKNLTPDKYRSKTLQPNINKIARLIDFGNPCIATGNYGKMNGGHRISVGSNRTTALNLHNIFIQSYQSNKFKGGDNIKYDIGLEKAFGIEYLDYIKAILHQAVRERIIGTNPFVYFKNKVRLTEVKIEYLEINEIQTLFNTKCNQKNIKDAFLFSCFTGLRLSDTRNLTWGNIEAEQIKFTQKKTKSQEYLPLSPTVVKILKNYKPKDKNNSSSPIFNLPSQQVVSVNLKKWGKDAGIKKTITFHIARHTFATMSLTTGTEVYTVSKLMGHRDLRQTQRYAKVIDATKVKAVNNLPRLKINKRQKLTQNI